MNMSKKEKGSAATVVPPRPTHQENQEATDEPNPNTKQRSGVMDPFASKVSSVSEVSKAASSESLKQPTDSNQNPGILKGVMQKVNPFKSSSQVSETRSSDSLEQGKASDSTQNPGVFKGVIQKVNPFKSSAQLPKNPQDDSNLQESDGALEDKQVDGITPCSTGVTTAVCVNENPGMMRGVIQKVNPFKSSQPKQTEPPHTDLSSSSGSLTDRNISEKQNPGMFKEMIHKVNPFRSNTQQVADGVCETDSVLPARSIQDDPSVHIEHSSSSERLDDTEIEKHTIWYADAASSSEAKNQPPEASRNQEKTFVLKKILPGSFFGSGSKGSAASTPEARPQETVQVQTLQMAKVPVPGDKTSLAPLDDDEGLLAWWKTVEGWDVWNEAKKDDESEEVVEEAADRVFMAARLFVRLFNQRGASLQQRILALLALADAADNFHRRTVTASMGGGMASVAGSVTTITGLILAPFTAGTSLVVTAVGIGVATAGGVTSASANITDTVHSKTDRTKVEKMIHDYQEEIKDIRECLEFLQEGMETLVDWDFEKYAEGISKKHLNQNVKHVLKEGGRAGKALVINTETLINTVQVLGVAGGAAKAAQVMTVTTGVMSGLFLALDVFFLAKDSMELKKGAKTEFAAKIREVCKDLQDGLLELNRIKEELQKTMDGIEVEVKEEAVEELLKE